MSITRRETVSLASGGPLSRRDVARGHGRSGKNPCHRQCIRSKGCRFETPNKAEIRDVLKGKLATGESWRCTKQRCLRAEHPTGTPSRAFRMWLIREGTVELTVNGTSYRLGPGSVGFVHSNDEHGIKNVGTTPADILCGGCGPRRGLLRSRKCQKQDTPLSRLKEGSHGLGALQRAYLETFTSTTPCFGTSAE